MANSPSMHRLGLLVGKSALTLLSEIKVIVFGLGGVGSWCAEALVRSGIGTLTIVDSDVVCVTNINRQVQATAGSVGKAKTSELGRRLREIRPEANIVEMQAVFKKSTADTFALERYDYVVDCIDSLSSKVELIERASLAGAKVYTALGASSKLDASKITSCSLWDSYNCPLGKFVRKRLRQRGFTGEVTCVYSPEEISQASFETACGSGSCLCFNNEECDDGAIESRYEWCGSKKRIHSSTVHITGTFGFMLAGLVVQDVVKRGEGKEEKIIRDKV